MDMLQIITQVGFPIAACVAMGYYVKYTNDQHTKETSELNAQHKEEITKITEALNNNTIALTRLCDKIGEHSLEGK